MSREAPRSSTPRPKLTAELKRLHIRTREKYTASGRTRSASRLADSVESPFNRSTIIRRSPTPGVQTVPVEDLLDGFEFESPLLAVGSFIFDEQVGPGEVSDLGDFAGDQEQTVRPLSQLSESESETEGEAEVVPEDPLDLNELNHEPVQNDNMALNYREVDGLVPEFDGRAEGLDRFIRGVELAMRLTHERNHPTLLEVVLVKLTGRAQVLAKEGMVYADWNTLKAELKHRFRATRSTKAIRKALESLYQGPDESVRQFALKVEDTLAEYISSDGAGVGAGQREALTRDREAQALEVFVDGLHGKLRDWAKARDFDSLKDAVDYALSEEMNIKPKARPMQTVVPKTGHDRSAPVNQGPGEGHSYESQGRNRGSRRKSRRGNRTPGSEGCFLCGETGHWSRECPQNGERTPKAEPSRVSCTYCRKLGHDVGRCFARKRDEEAAGQNVARPSYSHPNAMNPGVSKNMGGSSASPANIRSLQATTAQVHREPAGWNEIREAPEPAGNLSG